MSEHQPQDPQQTPQAPLAAGVSQTRRNLLRAGAIGAPALIALKPAPVIACDCKQPSGFTVSGNASRTGGATCTKPGRRATTWRSTSNCKTESPNYYYSGTTVYTIKKTTPVSDLGLLLGSYDSAATTVDKWLLKGDSSDQGMLMACYLEAVASGNGTTWPLKAEFVKMWNQGVVGSGYTPANQTKAWGKTRVIAYLKFLTGYPVDVLPPL